MEKLLILLGNTSGVNIPKVDVMDEVGTTPFFQATVFKYALLAIFASLAVSMLRVKSLLRKIHLAEHDRIYGKSWLDSSPASTWRVIKFSLSKNQWSFVNDATLMWWLHCYRTSSILFFGLQIIVPLAFVLRAVYMTNAR